MLWVYYRLTEATLEVARVESKLHMPKDAQLIRQYSQQDKGVLYVVDQFTSGLLVGLISSHLLPRLLYTQLLRMVAEDKTPYP